MMLLISPFDSLNLSFSCEGSESYFFLKLENQQSPFPGPKKLLLVSNEFITPITDLKSSFLRSSVLLHDSKGKFLSFLDFAIANEISEIFAFLNHSYS